MTPRPRSWWPPLHGGGALVNLTGTVTLSQCVIAGNDVFSPHEALGGGLSNQGGRMTVRGCSLLHNRAWTSGAAGETEMAGGGGIYHTGVLTIEATSIVSNAAPIGGGLSAWSGTAAVTDTTFSHNLAWLYGGGIANGTVNTMSFANGTISGNRAPLGAGAHNDFDSTLTFNHATIHGNVADQQGGGVDNHTGTVVLLHTILSGNEAGEKAHELFNDDGTVTAGAYNLFGHGGETDEQAFGDTFTPTVSSDVKATSDGTATSLEEILASSLEAHGGRTRTPALVAGSPAIDAVPAVSRALSADQRGVARPVDGDEDGTASCDIGASEYRPGLDGEARIYLPIVLAATR